MKILRLITALLILLPALAGAQVWKGVGIGYGSGAPTFNPGVRGGEIYIDTVSRSWYEYEPTTGVWRDAGYRIQLTNTTGAPSYTPSKARGRFALNSGDSLYAYQSGAWACLNCGEDLSGYVEWSDTTTFISTHQDLKDTAAAIRGDFPSPGLSGDGVAGYLPQYATASTLYTTGLYWNGVTRLGILNASPSYALDITADGQTSMRLRRVGGSATYLRYENTSYPHWLVGQEANSFIWYASSAYRMQLSTSGDLGLGLNLAPISGTRLAVRGTGTTSSTTALLVENSAGTDIIKADNGGFVTIGAGTNTSGAVLDVQSTAGVFTPPRMTTTQRDALTPPTGGIIFCTDCTATDGSTGVSQTYSSGTWKNHY